MLPRYAGQPPHAGPVSRP